MGLKGTRDDAKSVCAQTAVLKGTRDAESACVFYSKMHAVTFGVGDRSKLAGQGRCHQCE